MRNKEPAKPWHFENSNAHRFTIPASIAFFGLFMWIGLVNAEIQTIPPKWQFAQALLYLFFVTTIIFQIALHYISNSEHRNHLAMRQERFNKIVGLLIENNALYNLPSVRFVMQKESNEIGNRHLLTIVEVGGVYYEVMSDAEANYLVRVSPSRNLAAPAEELSTEMGSQK